MSPVKTSPKTPKTSRTRKTVKTPPPRESEVATNVVPFTAATETGAGKQDKLQGRALAPLFEPMDAMDTVVARLAPRFPL